MGINQSNHRTVINEYDQNPARSIQRKYRLKKRKRRRRILACILFLTACVYYFTSPYSKLTAIEIVGNQYINQEDIKAAAKYDENSLRMFSFVSKAKKNISELDGVKTVKVYKNLQGGLTIKITENKPIAYHQGENISVIFDSGDILELKDEQLLKNIQVLPNLRGFDEEHLKLFVQNYIQISESVRNQLSEIVFEPLEIDSDRVKLISNDNKISYVRIEDMVYQLENYNLIISQNPNDCYFDFLKGHVYKRSCE